MTAAGLSDQVTLHQREGESWGYLEGDPSWGSWSITNQENPNADWKQHARIQISTSLYDANLASPTLATGNYTLEDSLSGQSYNLTIGGSGTLEDLQSGLNATFGNGEATAAYEKRNNRSYVNIIGPQGVAIDNMKSESNGNNVGYSQNSPIGSVATANYDYVTETNPLNDVGYLNENYSLNGKGWAQVDANEANIAGIYNTPKQKYFFDPSDASFSAGAGDTVGFVTVSQRLDPSAEDSAASTNAGVSASLGDIDLVKSIRGITTITSAIDQVAGNRAEYGALQNRLEYTVLT